MSFSKKNLTKEKIAKEKLKKVLRKFGAKILDNEIPPEFSLTSFNGLDTRKSLGQFLGSKYDLMVSRNQEFYLVEVKYKSKEFFKTWVDKTSYDGYWKMHKFGAPFLYFIYVKETDKIYSHNVANPENFEKGYDSKGKQIYYLPKNSIHEIKPHFLNNIDVWFDCKIFGSFISKKMEEI